MLTIEQSNAVKNKLKNLGEKQNYLARKLKVTPQKLCNILNGKADCCGIENKILKWIGEN